MISWMRFCLLSVSWVGLALSASSCKTCCGECGVAEAVSCVSDLGQGVAVLQPTAGNTARGIVVFTAVEGGVNVEAKVEGLAPGQKHAIHVHEFGDLRADNGTATGGHYNPEGHDHALPSTEARHAGDLGNLEADAQGVATLSIVVTNITIAGHHNPVLGRGVIVHAKEDDGGQPTGNAGARIAQGVIGGRPEPSLTDSAQ